MDGTDSSPRPFAGQVAVVTGASRGIGHEVAKRLAAAGADVVGVARDEAALSRLGASARALGTSFYGISADLTDDTAIPHVVEEAHAWHGHIDVLVNCAGMTVREADLDIDPTSWDRVFALNARAPFFLAQEVGRRMLESPGGGSIVNVSSVAAVVTTGASVAYSASKAALIQTSRVLARRWAPKVRVNAVGPAYIATEFSSDWLADPANRDFVIDHTPMGRLGLPEDVADAVVFLASSHARYITGQLLLVDGGWTA